MKKLGKFILTILSLATIFGIFILGLLLFAAKANADLTAKANHDNIKVDFFYHGSTVSVKGTSNPGTDLVVKIASPEGHEVLKQKGKIAGFLWMNTGTLNFERTPNLYSIHSTKKIEDILSEEDMNKYVLGYSALKKHIEIKPVSNEPARNSWLNELIKFKESSNLYSTSVGRISTFIQDGRQGYYILTNWPYRAAPGDYPVTVYAVKDKKIIEQAEANVHVEQVGSIKALAQMAKNNAAVYGLISIVLAIGAGFGVGLVFKKGGAH